MIEKKLYDSRGDRYLGMTAAMTQVPVPTAISAIGEANTLRQNYLYLCRKIFLYLLLLTIKKQKRIMKRKLLSLLVLLMTAATGAWAQGYYDINVNFDSQYNPDFTFFICDIMGPDMPNGTLDLSVDGDLKGSFDVDGGMCSGEISPGLDAGDHTWSAVFYPEGGGDASSDSRDFTIDKANTYINYYGSTSINMGVGESTELDVYFSEYEAGELSYSSSDASVASITKKEYSDNTYIIQANAAGTATITFSFAGNTNYNAADNKTINVTVWPAIDVTANEGDAAGEYWATYYNSVMGYTADANTTVYQAKVNGTTTGVVLTEVASKVIPAGQGVVLKSSSSTITLTPVTTTATYSDNELQGTDAALTTPANAYCLSKETSGSSPRGVGFYTYTLATIPAHKAYLVVDGGPSSARGFLGFGDEDNTTGIGLPEAAVIEGDGPVFDLSGRQVMGQPQKGIYVKNGKKFVIK